MGKLGQKEFQEISGNVSSIQSNGDSLEVCFDTPQRKKSFEGYLDDLGIDNSEKFIRCNDSFIVNLGAVAKISRDNIETTLGENIFLSPKYAGDWVKSLFERDNFFVEDDHFYLRNRVKSNTSIEKISLKNISFIKSNGDYIKVFIENKNGDKRKLMTLSSLKNAEEKLPEEFIRCHRSYIINSNKIKEIYRDRVKTLLGEEVPVSMGYIENLKKYFPDKENILVDGDYLFLRHRVNSDRYIEKIPLKNISLVKSDRDYIEIYLEDEAGRKEIKTTLGTLRNAVEKFPEKFIQCNRSHIVNTNNISKIYKNRIKTFSGEEISISKGCSENLKEYFPDKRNILVDGNFLFLKHGISSDRYVERIPIQKVSFIESDRDYMKIYLQDESGQKQKMRVLGTLKNAEKKLSKNFIRCHNSYIVNKENISDISKNQVKLNSGEEISVSKTYSENVKDIFLEKK